MSQRVFCVVAFQGAAYSTPRSCEPEPGTFPRVARPSAPGPTPWRHTAGPGFDVAHPQAPAHTLCSEIQGQVRPRAAQAGGQPPLVVGWLPSVPAYVRNRRVLFSRRFRVAFPSVWRYFPRRKLRKTKTVGLALLCRFAPNVPPSLPPRASLSPPNPPPHSGCC